MPQTIVGQGLAEVGPTVRVAEFIIVGQRHLEGQSEPLTGTLDALGERAIPSLTQCPDVQRSESAHRRFVRTERQTASLCRLLIAQCRFSDHHARGGAYHLCDEGPTTPERSSLEQRNLMRLRLIGLALNTGIAALAS